MRFGDRLRVTFEIADEAQQAMVPCFFMRPLIENAIIHGLRGVLKTEGEPALPLQRPQPEREPGQYAAGVRARPRVSGERHRRDGEQHWAAP